VSPTTTTRDELLRAALAAVLEPRVLHEDEAARAMHALLEPEAPAVLLAGLLVALRARGESAAELAGAARALLDHAPRVTRAAGPCVDTCGTGGDGRGSFNLSSATALLVAALGIPVAKHGNRAVSSRAGSSDFFAALGVPRPTSAGEAALRLARDGFVALHAPHFHPALAHLAPLRRELGVRTLFNLLGPLVNPARPSHQLVGAASPASARALAGALARLAVERAFVVHGAGGFDEATPTGPVLLLDVRPARVLEHALEPRDFGLARCSPEDLAGGDAGENAERLRALFRGERGPLRDALCLNAALVLLLLEREHAPRAALAAAAQALDGGRAREFLARVSDAGAMP
jgi:anthranilate phosphoribosyltransferase